MTTPPAAAAAPPETEPPFRLKFLPLLVTVLLGAFVTLGSAVVAQLLSGALHLPSAKPSLLAFLFVQHGFQLLLALIAIVVLKYRFVPADYGLHWPRGRTYSVSAIVWGAVVATLVAAGNSWLDAALHIKGSADGITYTHRNVWGWAVFLGLYVGPTEEIPFRALLVTYLAATMPGKLRIGRFNMNCAGIIVAVLFALAHIDSFWQVNWVDALVQQGYALTLGIFYAYWLEKSKSIVAPIIAHNITDGLTIVFWALGLFQS